MARQNPTPAPGADARRDATSDASLSASGRRVLEIETRALEALAARLDGAGPWREFRAVTLPGVRRELGVCVAVTAIAALASFDVVYATTRGGPGGATSVPGLEVFSLAFAQREVGRASALAVVLVVLVLAVVALLVGWGLVTAPFDWELGALPRDPVPVDAIPDLSENQVIVFTEWMGRSPQIMEDQVTYPLVTAMLGVPQTKVVRGQSMFGTSFVYVIFDDGTEASFELEQTPEPQTFTLDAPVAVDDLGVAEEQGGTLHPTDDVAVLDHRRDFVVDAHRRAIAPPENLAGHPLALPTATTSYVDFMPR